VDPRDKRIAELEAIVKRQAAEIEALKAQVALLLERLSQNSRNSHLPPSSDGPGGRGKTLQKKAGDGKKRKRGGQRGHKGHQRGLLPPDQVDHVIDLFPPECENCWTPLPETADPDAKRYQVTEIPKIQPETTEYRRHSVTCGCGYTTRGPVDKVPTSPFGPQLMGLVALFTGVYHLSRRQTVSLLQDVLGVGAPSGAIFAIDNLCFLRVQLQTTL